MFGDHLYTAAINNDGIGMDLVTCKNLVYLNGGTIRVHSDGKD